MSITEYLENLNRLKKLAVNRWGSLSLLERSVVEGSFDWLVNNLEIKRGEIVVDEQLSELMDQFVKAVVDVVNEVPLYRSKLNSFLQDLTTIQTNNKIFHRTTNKFDINTAGVNGVQKAVVGQVIDQYVGNGLNVHFAAPLKDNVFRNILLGANMKEVKSVLQTYILSGQDKSGKLASYIDQTAMQAVDSYTGAINQEIAAEFTFTGYIISGSLIETSSLQCVTAVDEADQQYGYLSYEQWEEILQIARDNPKARLIPGTTIKNLPLNKLHWGCRHDFTPVIMTLPGKPKKIVAKKPKTPPVKKPEVPKPAEKAPAKEKPAKQTGPKKAFKKAETIAEAKEVSRAIMEQNAGLKIKEVVIGADVPVPLMNKMNQVLNELTETYNLSPVVKKEYGTQLLFQSNARNYGSVKSQVSGRMLLELNYGSRSDKNRDRVYSFENRYMKGKSRVDTDNLEVATVVHEFAHTMTLWQSKAEMSTIESVKDFWPSLERIRRQYRKAIKGATPEEFEQLFLGSYASTNMNEFLAEAFTEYRLTKNPSKYAAEVGNLVDKYFKK